MSISAADPAPISVLVPTLNEERNLAACLGSVRWADEIVVFDSYSDDDTLRIAEAAGARVVQRRFDDFATHKNWALDEIDFRHPWLFILDADERVTSELEAEIRETIASPTARNGYYVARKNIFAGQWIRRANMYPDHQLRLFRRGTCRYEARIVHEHMICDGRTGSLAAPLVHHDYKGIERYVDRHNTYSSLEAVAVERWLRGLDDGGLPSDLFGSGPERKRAIKRFAYRYMPLRAFVYFLWMYVIRLGFLDGGIGLRYCLLRYFYEYQVDLKRLELRDPVSPIARKYAALLSDGEETSNPACPDCAGVTELLYRDLFDTRFGIEQRVNARRCRECGWAFCDPKPSAAELAALYSDHYNFAGARTSRYDAMRDRFFASSLYGLWTRLDSDISFHARRGRGRLLEVGCNEGRNLGFYGRSGFTAEGQEINPVAVEAARSRGFTVHEGDIDAVGPDHAFDVVVLSQVLEHALDPEAMLRQVHRLLAPGGEVWISCPNIDSWSVRLFGRYWINWHVPFHITHFDSSSLKRVAEAAGFVVREESQDTPGLWVALSMIGRLTAKPGRVNRTMRNPAVVIALLGLARGLLFPLLWWGNRQGKGDCLKLIAEAR
jgi:glycosyltransferase involved in cell wall biosynthesis